MKLLRALLLGCLLCCAAWLIWVPLPTIHRASQQGDNQPGTPFPSFADPIIQDDRSKYRADTAMVAIVDTSGMRVVTVRSCDSRGCESGEDWFDTQYEPGSIVKPLLTMFVYTQRAIDVSTMLSDQGKVDVGGRRILNASANYPLHYNIETLLGTSRNTGAIQLLDKLGGIEEGGRRWNAFLARLWNDTYVVPAGVRDEGYRLALSSFGIGITTTPREVVLSYALVASPQCPQSLRARCTLVSDESRGYARRVLATVADTAYHLPSTHGCQMAGKSGTASIAGPLGEYEPTAGEAGTFVGFIVTPGSRYVALVHMDRPEVAVASSAARATWIRVAQALCAQANINTGR